MRRVLPPERVQRREALVHVVVRRQREIDPGLHQRLPYRLHSERRKSVVDRVGADRETRVMPVRKRAPRGMSGEIGPEPGELS